MTPGEFMEAVDGHVFREDRADDRMAWTVSHLLAPHITKPKRRLKFISIDELLGRKGELQSADALDSFLAEDAAAPGMEVADDKATKLRGIRALRQQLKDERAAGKHGGAVVAGGE